MPKYQAYNGRINAYVKYEFVKGKGFKVIDVKQVEPSKQFKGIKIKGNKK